MSKRASKQASERARKQARKHESTQARKHPSKPARKQAQKQTSKQGKADHINRFSCTTLTPLKTSVYNNVICFMAVDTCQVTVINASNAESLHVCLGGYTQELPKTLRKAGPNVGKSRSNENRAPIEPSRRFSSSR